MSPSFEYLRVRKHWKFRIVMVPIELALLAIGYTRDSNGFWVAAMVLMALTTFPYWPSDARTARDLKARRARTLPQAETTAATVTVSRMPARPTVADLDAHVQHLCAAYGIERRLGGRGIAYRRGPAGRRQPGIRIPPIRSQITYAIALHELGHLIGPGRSGTRLEKEAAAWRWALAASMVPLSDHARRSAGRRLRSYVIWAQHRQHRMRPPRIPEAGSPFWSLLAELEA